MLETFYIDCHCPQNLISVSYHISGQLTCLTMKQPYPLQNFSLDLNFSEEWLARPYRGQSPLALGYAHYFSRLRRLLALAKILPRLLLLSAWSYENVDKVYVYIYIYICYLYLLAYYFLLEQYCMCQLCMGWEM